MAVVVMVIITGVVVTVVMVVIIAAAAVIAPKKGSGKNPEKLSPQRKGKFPSGFLIQNGARVGVIGALINILPA